MKRNRALLRLVLVLIPLGCVLLLTPIPVVSRLEESDRFCTSCHLAPEETYFRRALAALASEEPAADLAAAHYPAAQAQAGTFRCIDCHRGDGQLQDRAQTLLLGARDTLTFLSGRADQAIEKTHADAADLLERGCLKCHTESMMERGFNNHHHSQLPHAGLALQAGVEPSDPPGGMTPEDIFSEFGESDTALTCLDCHQAHRSFADGAALLYLDIDNVLMPACEQCHREGGRGPTDLTNPGGS